MTSAYLASAGIVNCERFRELPTDERYRGLGSCSLHPKAGQLRGFRCREDAAVYPQGHRAGR